MNVHASPWYRHRWPWILFGIPVLTIVAGVVTITLAISSNDGLVVDDYYKQGLAINSQLARVKMAEGLELRARIVREGEELLIAMAAREGVALPETLRLKVAHATRAGLDREVLAYRSEDGYRAALIGLDPGRWHLVLQDEAAAWRLDAAMVWPLAGMLSVAPSSR